MDEPNSGGDPQESHNVNLDQISPEATENTMIQAETITTNFLSNIDPTRLNMSAIRSSWVAIFGEQAEEVTFPTLLQVIWKNLTLTAKAYFIMLISLSPAFELFYYIIRFSMDSVNHIIQRSNWKDRAITGLTFAVQMTVVIFIIIFVFGTLLYPIYYILFKIFL
ncbi:hypothetical protein L9F63_015037 [Diploptera punctata]|uniref:Uncharacterized protein n=1 Tax=Diploptera punctata TaxID=6984 RepID=A0AAD8EKD2_DIPPU|nr:hypothetical protein L9F63_015037 [Diploptera punctata]